MPGGRARQLTRNATSGGGRYGVAALLALAVTPYALGVLGDERFGVWALAGAVLVTLRLLDLGLKGALTRAVADAEGRDNRAAVGPALATSRVLSLVLAAAMVALAWLLRAPVVAILRVPEALRAEAAYVVVGTAVVAAIETTFAPFQATLDGVGRMDLTNAVDTAQRLLSGLGVFLVLSAGWGLQGLVWKNALTALLAGLAYRALMRRRAPDLKLAPLGLDWKEARALLAYGRHIQTVNLGALLIEPVSKVLLSRNVGLEAVTIFELATRVTSQIAGAFFALSAALFPATAEMRSAAGSAGDRAVMALYRPASRYLAWLVLPIFALLMALAGPFITAWLGPGYAEVSWAIRVLGAGWLVALLSTPAFLVAQAGGREGLSTAASLVTVGVALGAALTLVGPAGLGGVVVGVALGLAAGGVAILLLFARSFGIAREAVAMIGWRVVLAALLGALVARAASAALGASLAAVALAGMAGLLVAGAVLLATGALGLAERHALARVLRPKDRPPPG